jgi:hypothetical protein
MQDFCFTLASNAPRGEAYWYTSARPDASARRRTDDRVARTEAEATNRK